MNVWSRLWYTEAQAVALVFKLTEVGNFLGKAVLIPFSPVPFSSIFSTI
jgi:hypothetical protein